MILLANGLLASPQPLLIMDRIFLLERTPAPIISSMEKLTMSGFTAEHSLQMKSPYYTI